MHAPRPPTTGIISDSASKHGGRASCSCRPKVLKTVRLSSSTVLRMQRFSLTQSLWWKGTVPSLSRSPACCVARTFRYLREVGERAGERTEGKNAEVLWCCTSRASDHTGVFEARSSSDGTEDPQLWMGILTDVSQKESVPRRISFRRIAPLAVMVHFTRCLPSDSPPPRPRALF